MGQPSVIAGAMWSLLYRLEQGEPEIPTSPVCLAVLLFEAMETLSFYGVCSFVSRSVGVSEEIGSHLMAVEPDPDDRTRIRIEVTYESVDAFRACIYYVPGTIKEKWGDHWTLTLCLPELDKQLLRRLLDSSQKDTREWAIKRLMPVIYELEHPGDKPQGE